MSKYTDDLAFEEALEGTGVIRLIKSGTFYRAYDHSAWLFVNAIAQYKVVRRFLKASNRDVFFIGFPVGSVHDIIGHRQTIITEHGFDVVLSPEEIPSPEGYQTWRTTVEAEPASKANFVALPLSGVEAEHEVACRLRTYPMESKTMIESVVFLADLRKMVLNNK